MKKIAKGLLLLLCTTVFIINPAMDYNQNEELNLANNEEPDLRGW